MKLTYKNAVEMLQSQSKFYISLGLERILKILDLTGNPQNKTKIIHVAGSNGKGSVSSVLANILKSASYKTGLYTSPHLIEYTERIKINNKDISEDDFALYIEKICSVADSNNINLTEFEILTACAYLYFYENKTDIAVIETGLGGRYDATNTVENKLLSVITSISLDHTDRLGDTIDKIAYEKAGIITKSSNVVVSSCNEGLNIIKEVCEKQNSVIHFAPLDVETVFENGQNYLIYNAEKYEFPLLGLYQKKNMALVLKAVEFLNDNSFNIPGSALKQGLKTVQWHARLEYIKDKNILLDGAHNPDAAIELRKSLDFYFKNQQRIFIYSTLSTKDYKTINKILFRPEDKIYYYEFNHNNAVSYNEYILNTNSNNIFKFHPEELTSILNSEELKIVTGSLYMIGEFTKAFL